MIDRLQPFVRAVFSRNFDCQMAKPAIWGCAVPVFHSSRNVNTVTRFHLDGILAPLLIVPAPGHADQNLSAALVGVMDMPVVPAARFKGHIENADL